MASHPMLPPLGTATGGGGGRSGLFLDFFLSNAFCKRIRGTVPPNRFFTVQKIVGRRKEKKEREPKMIENAGFIHSFSFKAETRQKLSKKKQF